jgi:acyl-CoA dehydrogenase
MWHNTMVPDEWRQLLGVCTRFVDREIVPHVLDADQASRSLFVKKMLQRLAEIGIPGILVPEDFGGTRLGPLAAALTLDIIGRGCAGVAVPLAYHLAAQSVLIEAGSDLQKEQWLVASMGENNAEPVLGACIFPPRDPTSHDDPAALALDGDAGDLRLKGNAGLVVGAGLASFLIIFVRSRENVLEGPVTAMLIPADRDGVKIAERETFGGLKALPINPVTFDGVRIEEQDVIGEIRSSHDLMSKTRHTLHAFIGAIAMGVGRSAYEKAFHYAGERYQYGKYIIQHQEIQRMLGAMLTSLHAGTALYMRALAPESLGEVCSDSRGEYAKIFCTNATLEITLDAVQIHGGYGYMQDYGVEKLMRDAKMLQLLEGTNPVLQIDAVSRIAQEKEPSDSA